MSEQISALDDFVQERAFTIVHTHALAGANISPHPLPYRDELETLLRQEFFSKLMPLPLPDGNLLTPNIGDVETAQVHLLPGKDRGWGAVATEPEVPFRMLYFQPRKPETAPLATFSIAPVNRSLSPQNISFQTGGGASPIPPREKAFDELLPLSIRLAAELILDSYLASIETDLGLTAAELIDPREHPANIYTAIGGNALNTPPTPMSLSAYQIDAVPGVNELQLP